MILDLLLGRDSYKLFFEIFYTLLIPNMTVLETRKLYLALSFDVIVASGVEITWGWGLRVPRIQKSQPMMMSIVCTGKE